VVHQHCTFRVGVSWNTLVMIFSVGAIGRCFAVCECKQNAYALAALEEQ